MSQTNLDLFLQVVAPIGERPSAYTPRIDETGAGFRDHLGHLSATIGNSTGRANARSAANDSSPFEYGVPSTASQAPQQAARDDTAEDDRRDRDEDYPADNSAPPAAAGAGNDYQKGAYETGTAEQGGAPDAAASETVDNHGAPENVEPQNKNAAVAEFTNKSAVSTARQESRESTAAADATPVADPTVAEATDERAGDGDAMTHAQTASLPNAAAAAAEIAIGPAAQSSSDEITSSKTTKRSRAATATTNAEDTPRPQRGEPIANHVHHDEQLAAEAAPTVAGDAHQAAGADQMLELGLPPDDRAEEGRDASARTSVRERADAAALVNKLPAAVIALGPSAPSASRVAAEGNSDGAARARGAAEASVDAAAEGAHRALASTSPSKRANRASGTHETPRVDPARFVGRVAKAFHTAQERGGTLQIRLNPPELGAMRLELTVKDGVMTAALETETASARRVLLEHLPALRDRLAEQNIRVERFDVDVRRDETGGQADPRGTQDQQQPYQDHSGARRLQTRTRPIAETARPITPIMPTQPGDTGINLVA